MRMPNDAAEAKLAQAEIIDHAMCDECDELYLFAMRKGDDEFTVGLSTVLACLAFAEREGAVPDLPVEWWWKVGSVHG